MFYSCILLSEKSHIFYYGYTENIAHRLSQHNTGLVVSTKSHKPWKLIWYGAFLTEKEARGFELYLKSGSGKAFAYKRLILDALAKDLLAGRNSNPKPSTVAEW